MLLCLCETAATYMQTARHNKEATELLIGRNLVTVKQEMGFSRYVAYDKTTVEQETGGGFKLN